MGRDIDPATWTLIQLFDEGIEMRQKGENTWGLSQAAADIMDSLDDLRKGDVIIDLLGLYYAANQEVTNQWIKDMERGSVDG